MKKSVIGSFLLIIALFTFCSPLKAQCATDCEEQFQEAQDACLDGGSSLEWETCKSKAALDLDECKEKCPKE